MLVAGVDVWLNTPRRPQEASGTSGMKAALNGALNLSIARRLVARGVHARDRLGDRRGEVEDEAEQDAADAEELFRLLEQEVVPALRATGRAGSTA